MPDRSTGNRSVVDFENEDALLHALSAGARPKPNGADSTKASPHQDSESHQPAQNDAQIQEGATRLDQKSMDWVLPNADPDSSEPQSMKEELHRLQVLKSYAILDAEREEAFDRLTRLAARYFQVDIALISLVDLGRQWFVSSRGIGDVRETPRKVAFCAHAIINKNSLLIVPDATTDYRFKENPAVEGPLSIRFYAGAPLICPEGYKLGTFCIVDDKPRPEGLSEEDQSTLKEFADMAVKEMVERRANMDRNKTPARLIAYTAHDLMTPLTGVQLSLSLLREDDDVKERLAQHHREVLSTAAHCSDLMIRICQTALDALRRESNAVPEVQAATLVTNASAPITKMSELIKSLTMIMEPIPKKVPLVITVDANVPSSIMSDELKLFRSTLNIISNGLGRTEAGMVHLRIFVKPDDASKIFFECEDTGLPVKVEEYKYLFRLTRTAGRESRLGLSSVATLITSLDGEYGFQPAEMTDAERPEDAETLGAIFWFSVPLYTPESFGLTTDEELPMSVIRKISSSTSVRRDHLKQPIIAPLARSGSKSSVASDSMPHPSEREKAGDPKNGGRALFDTQHMRKNSSSKLLAAARNGSVNSLSSRRSDGRGGELSPMQNSVFGRIMDPMARPDSKLAAVPKNVSISTVPTGSSPPASLKRKKRALIIEDSLVVRKSLARALEQKLGMAVTQAVNGSAGLDRMKAIMFDLVLCDFLMPVMDGIDCVRQYREWEKKNRPEFSQYIVGISAHADANDGNKGISAGMNEFRPKPVSITILTEIIEKNTTVTGNSTQLDEIETAQRAYDSESSSTSLVDLSARSIQSSLNLTREGSCNHFGKRSTHAALSSQQNHSFDLMQNIAKRQKLHAGLTSRKNQDSPVCLIAVESGSQLFDAAIANLEGAGWKIAFVHDRQNALREMEQREWNGVLVDEGVSHGSKTTWMESFRSWERKNRSHRQQNCFLVCSAQLPSSFDETSVVLPPSGFDGALGKPVLWKELKHVLGIEASFS